MTRNIHEKWSSRKFHSSMVTRYAHSVYHNLALGRGPIRAITKRHLSEDQKHCRHGCGCVEDLQHLLLDCKAVRSQRKAVDKVLKKKGLDLSIANMLSIEDVREDVEKMILTFLA